jgi:hypothetical protein
MTVKQLLACLDAKELVEWQAFFLMESKDREDRKGQKEQSPETTSEQLKVEMARFNNPTKKSRPKPRRRK